MRNRVEGLGSMARLALLLALSLLARVAVEADCLLQAFDVRRIPGAVLGAEVVGLDLESITDDQFQLVEHHLLEHKVLVFRNQSRLSIDGQRAFSRRFGPLQVHIEKSSHLEGYDDVNVIGNQHSAQGGVRGLAGTHVEQFHADLSWAEKPSKYTILKSVIRPTSGGDTLFCDSGAAFRVLPRPVQDQLSNLWGTFSYLKHRPEMVDEVEDDATKYLLLQGSVHPLITMHPVTGEQSIFANPADLVHVLDVQQETSDSLMQLLFTQVEDPRFHYSHKWLDGDVLVWDNRAVLHRGTAAVDSPRRLIRTTTVVDQAPRPHWTQLESPPALPC